MGGVISGRLQRRRSSPRGGFGSLVRLLPVPRHAGTQRHTRQRAAGRASSGWQGLAQTAGAIAAGSVVSLMAIRIRERTGRATGMARKSWGELIAEARDALEAAERELAVADLERNGRSAHDPLAATVAELAALDAGALERVRDEVEAAINRYVIAAVTYNRVLNELRDELLQHGLDAASVDYRDVVGQTGVRVNEIVKLNARPREALLHIVRGALDAHGLDGGAPNAERAPSAEEPPAETQHVPSDSDDDRDDAPVPMTLPTEQLEELKDEWLAPVLAQIAHQTAEIEQLHGRIDLQQEHIDHLREQLSEQAEVTVRVTSFLNAIRQA
jgi:hypothetical protein